MHIVGEGPRGPWARQGVFAPPFAHEPDVVRGPKGEWVMTCAPPPPPPPACPVCVEALPPTELPRSFACRSLSRPQAVAGYRTLGFQLQTVI